MIITGTTVTVGDGVVCELMTRSLKLARSMDQD